MSERARQFRKSKGISNMVYDMNNIKSPQFSLDEYAESYADQRIKEVLDKNKKLKEMLSVAQCPEYNDCRGSGTLTEVDEVTGEPYPAPCQWCYERDEVCGTSFTNPKRTSEKENNEDYDLPF